MYSLFEHYPFGKVWDCASSLKETHTQKWGIESTYYSNK